ncbi:MAG TPA: hypothetical protein VGS97_09165 [Actinocrinis sp.]|uniref:hypothetical protein n=1 Tax=Actinocrinis sp. TaxID=1920516 RepID=UPI002DDD8073|nr:hypothetical protein [Actinocrinis sp.]HEV2344249.1 hypothetical protein [Actinocrinis sp.]
MTRPLRTLLPIAAAFASVALTGSAAIAAPVGDPAPIGPNTPFIALVNGKTADAVIAVVCPFPPTPGELGAPLSGQYVEVEPEVVTPTGTFGFTGSAANSIDAVFTPASALSEAIVIKDWFVQVPIPTTLRLPCSGSGVVSFDPMPTSNTAHSYTVTVTYGNVATG